MKTKGNLLITLLIILCVVSIGIAGYFYRLNKELIQKVPLSWEECVKIVGSFEQTSYPAICVSPDGRRVIQPISDIEKRKLSPAKCEVTDPSFCDVLAKVDHMVAINDFVSITDLEYKTAKGYSVGDGYEGSYVSETQLAKVLFDFTDKYGPFWYKESFVRENKGLMLFLDKDQKWALGFYVRKGAMGWLIYENRAGVASSYPETFDQSKISLP